MNNLRFFIFTIILLLFNQLIFAQDDPREKSHSISILPFTESSGQKYYLTWSSSSGSVDGAWQHDIYRQIVFFDSKGILQIENGPERYIGNGADEAQEPVSVALKPDSNFILSVWEDGSGSSVDIRGQLHRPDGRILRHNWIIAGGSDSQHSPVVVHQRNRFLVAYTDEAPPAEFSMNKARILDDQNGNLLQTVDLSPVNEDNWWPVAASDENQFAFVGWGDYENFNGSLVKLGTNSAANLPQQQYLPGMKQYYYSVAWLEKLSRFIAVAKSGFFGEVCFIDTNGVRTNFIKILNAPIARETNLAVRWDETNQRYLIVYPSQFRDVALLYASGDGIKLGEIIKGLNHPVLKNITWPTTGVACRFLKSINGVDLWNSKKIIFFAYSDTNSNNAVLLPVEISTETGFDTEIGKFFPQQFDFYPAYPNPFNSRLVVEYRLRRKAHVRLTVLEAMGRQVALLSDEETNPGLRRVTWSAEKIASGIYFLRLKVNSQNQIQKVLLLR